MKLAKLLRLTLALMFLAVGCNESHKAMYVLYPRPGETRDQLEDRLSQALADDLRSAVTRGNKDQVAYLLSLGADANAKYDDGSTALHRAASLGYKEIAKLLVAKGADLNSKMDDLTPLHMAAFAGHEDIVRLLITKGADVNAKDTEGRTPLQLAEETGHKEIVKLLRKHGAKE